MAQKQQHSGGKSWIFWGAGLLIVIVVVVVGLLTIPSGSDEAEEPDEGLNAEGPDPSAEPVEPEEEEPTEAEGEGPARCEDMDADSAFPTEAPAFEWQDFDGAENFSVPVSDEHGPAVQEDGFWRCFSQTPTGAAIAAPILFADFVAGDTYEAAVDSPGARSAYPAGDPEASEAFDGLLVRGFRIVDSSDSEATVQLWVSVPDTPGDAMFEFILVWDDEANDWRVDLASGAPPVEVIEDTSDYVEWR
ncbi:hypothetical protein I2485_14975 [Nesterenkonia sp. E16_7]|uniref:hypothetical protein n=1 Tax=unclassified Nesterenkonia TaxID=2629769 RepID=UPI001A91B670|nr:MULTISPECIES: hypothetical protein [unclassified Nesterenkonia]MBO0596761.1 hypothetical protein [Nesterenkonia sp. E16_10]MBO0599952.1 hypothetical protein [Nesterenkonia sp. E16_7]